MLIKQKLPLVIVLMVSVPLIILSFIIYRHAYITLSENSKKHIGEITRIESESITALMTAQKKEVELLATNEILLRPIIVSLNAEKNKVEYNTGIQLSDKFLKNYTDRFPQLEDSFILNTDGIIISGSVESLKGISMRDRNYFIEAMSGKVAVSNVLKSRYNQDNVIAIAAPLKDETGKIRGVVVNGIKIQYFTGYVSKIQVGNSGYAFLVDSEGTVIAHKDEEEIGLPTENDIIKELVRQLKAGKSVGYNILPDKYKGEERVMGYSVISDLNWVLSVTQSMREIQDPAERALYTIWVIFLIFWVLSIIAGVAFSRTIVKPINKLMKAMKRAESGDFNSKCDYKSDNELGELSLGYNNMLSRLNVGYEELTAVYKQLSAAEEELRTQYKELEQNQEYLKNSEERYRLALDSANDAIFECNFITGGLFVSDKWEDITGYSNHMNWNYKEAFRLLADPKDMRRIIKDIKKHIVNGQDYVSCEFRTTTKNGENKWLEVKGKITKDERGRLVQITGSLSDISERKQNEESIRYLAYYDTLTHLPNRITFIQALNDMLAKALGEGTKGTVLFLDLDNFKKINDTLGHDYGDNLLSRMAEELQAIKGDKDVVCRFGGDEFLILLPEVGSKEFAEEFANKVLEIFHEPFEVNGKQLFTTCSIGITIFPEDGRDTNIILKNADTAMYKAKETGKNRYAFYDREMFDSLERKTKIEKALRGSIENGELQLHYQPQFNVATSEITGFEALLRLNSRDLGFVSPVEFIPIAEETGLIVPIGKWVLREACMKNSDWQSKGYGEYCMAVNISSVQLQHSGFLEMVEGVLAETKLSPHSLELEITESVLMKSVDDNARVLAVLRESGVKIALDDFGTGYSSLSYLRRIPIDTLKIDKSFIDNICLNANEEAIAEGIIQLAHQMNLEVIAEGVEESRQLKLLYDKKCDKAQGYLFSRPLPVEFIEDMLNKRNKI